MEKVVKIFPPNRLISAPYGTIHTIDTSVWGHVISEKTNDHYIQVSQDEDKPEWKTMGDFLTVAFAEQLEKKIFIDQCLQMYKLQQDEKNAYSTQIGVEEKKI